jgi:hypothetical protein
MSILEVYAILIAKIVCDQVKMWKDFDNGVPLNCQPVVLNGEPGRVPRRGPLQIPHNPRNNEQVCLVIEETEILLACLRDIADGTGGFDQQNRAAVSLPLLRKLHDNLVFLVVMLDLQSLLSEEHSASKPFT